MAGFGRSFPEPRHRRVGDFLLRQASEFWRFSGEQIFLRHLASNRETIGELVKPYGTSHAQLVRQLFHRHRLKLARCRGDFHRNARIPLGSGQFTSLD